MGKELYTKCCECAKEISVYSSHFFKAYYNGRFEIIEESACCSISCLSKHTMDK